MASIIKSKISQTIGNEPSDTALQEETMKYRLLVTAGPSYDLSTHKIVDVNTRNATVVSNEFLTAKIKVRVRRFNGLPSKSPPDSPYFDDPIHARDQYSIGFTFVPKQDIPSLDTVCGNDFDHPVRDKIPPLFNTAFKIVKEFIDPGLECDPYADEPWLYGPSLSSWFAFRIGEEISPSHDTPGTTLRLEDLFSPPSDEIVMTEGADGHEAAQIRQDLGLPDDNQQRRKHFLSPANREAFTFQKYRNYSGDFYNPYIDFSNFALKLPGISLKVIKYVDQKSHCLRYVFKNRNTGDMYFNVDFHLLWGETLKKALDQDERSGGSVDWIFTGNASSQNGDLFD